MDSTPCPWSAFPEASIAFCERRLCAWVVEPSYAWSNFAYLAVGAVILWMARRQRPHTVHAIGVTSVLIGLGSFAFHATGTRAGELVDVSSMYLLSALALSSSLQRTWRWSWRAVLASYGLVAGGSIALLIFGGGDGILVFGAQVIVTVVLEMALSRRPDAVDYRPLRWVVGLMTLGFGIWNAELFLYCNPDNHLLTGHAIWHAMTALAIYHLYRFHRQFAAARA
jgi:hypothetical protein